MCPLILIEHMYLLWYMAKLEVLNEHQKDMCYDEIGLTMCSKNINNHFKFKSQHNWDALYDRVNRKITIAPLNLCSWSRIQKSKKMTVFAICDCQLDETLPNSIQRSKLCVELEVPTIGLPRSIDSSVYAQLLYCLQLVSAKAGMSDIFWWPDYIPQDSASTGRSELTCSCKMKMIHHAFTENVDSFNKHVMLIKVKGT